MLKEIYNRILSDNESESEASGYLSTRAEWHSAAWGFSTAFLSIFFMRPEIFIASVGWMFTRAGDRKVPEFIPYKDQFLKESLYVFAHAIPGIALGYIARVVIL